MKAIHIGLAAGALLLIAAQDAPTPPAEGSSFSEAFAEQSNAAKAEQTADELAKPAEAVEPPPAEPAAEPASEPEVKPAEASEHPLEPAAPPAGEPEAKPSEAAPEPAAALPAEPETAPKLAKGDPVTRDFLVGVWAEPGKSCEAGIDFQADGRMIGPFPRWELAEGELTMVGNRQKMRLTVIDQDTIQSRRGETDPARTLKRCPKAPPPPKP